MPTAKGATVSVLGRKISWDALLIAGAGVAGVFFLFRAGQPVASLPAASLLPAGSTSSVDSGAPPLGVVPPGNLGAPPPDPTGTPSAALMRWRAKQGYGASAIHAAPTVKGGV